VARNRLPLALFTWLTSLIALVLLHTPILRAVPNDIKVIRYRDNNSAEIFANGQASPLHTGERLGPWSLMAIVDDDRSKPAFVILEDFSQQTGHLLFVDQKGVRLDLPKSLEPTSQDPANLYLGHTLDEIVNSPTDLLADQILAKPGDPNYDEVASVFPPIRKIPTYSFVGTNTTMDKVGFAYGGRSPNFDPLPITLRSAKSATKAACSTASSADTCPSFASSIPSLPKSGPRCSPSLPCACRTATIACSRSGTASSTSSKAR
jgi:hypothetical protein